MFFKYNNLKNKFCPIRFKSSGTSVEMVHPALLREMLSLNLRKKNPPGFI